MNNPLSRSLLLDILQKWQSGQVTAQYVHELAESFTEAEDFAEFPPDDDRSIDVEVLMHLDALTTLPVTPADIPAMLRFLKTPSGNAVDGWAAWISYWDNRNEADRRAEVVDDPFYVV